MPVQVSCPYCGSILTFHQPVAAGTAVSCLICSRTFLAPAVAAATPAPAPPPAPRPAPVPQPPANLPHPKPAAPAVAVPPPAPRPAAAAAPAPKSEPKRHRPAAPHGVPAGPSAASRAIGGAALAAVVLLMLGTLAFAFWKNVLAVPRDDGPASGPAVTAITKKDETKAAANETVPERGPTPPVTPETKKPPEPAKVEVEPDEPELPKPGAKKPNVPLVQRVKKDEEPEVKTPAAPVVRNTQASSAAGVTKERVDQAIANGVRFLRTRQHVNGRFVRDPQSVGETHGVGLTALGGLTLLESKVPPNDPAVQRAASFVRSNLRSTNENYDVAVAILFLDRLGDPGDRAIVQYLGLQTLCNQIPGGGWGYHHELQPSPTDLANLFLFLNSHQPRKQALRAPPRPNAIFPAPGFGPDNRFAEYAAALGRKLPPASDKPAAADPEQARIPLERLPAPLQSLPAVRALGLDKVPPPAEGQLGDNSNGQFAMLALWTARRHDVPVDPALRLASQRFLVHQGGDGTWPYQFQTGAASSPSMTCVGLLALAMGHGASRDGKAGPAKADEQDFPIQKGLQAVGKWIDHPVKEGVAPPKVPDLYFAWSVERVAMLYGLDTIGGKDWYGWGAQALLAHQERAGNWNCLGQYAGAGDFVDTCFALLFLSRSNLVQDLTEELRLFMAVRDPAGGP